MEVRFLKNSLWIRSTTDPNPIGGPVPVVSSINRVSTNPTGLQSLQWTAKFSQVVTGVGTGDFSLVQSAGLSGATLTSVVDTGDSKTFIITADSGINNGGLGLNLVDDDSITNGVGQKLGGTGAGNGNFTGAVYTVNRVISPTGSIIFGASSSGDPINISGLTDAKWGTTTLVTRSFSGATGSTQDGTHNTPYKWNTSGTSTKNGMTPDRHNMISWKPPDLAAFAAGTAGTTASFNAWFAGAPTDKYTDLTMWHETDRGGSPYGNASPTYGPTVNWCNAMDRLITMVNNFGNPFIRVGLILTAGGSAASTHRRWDWQIGTSTAYMRPGMKFVGLDFDGPNIPTTYPGDAKMNRANWWGYLNPDATQPFMKGGFKDIPNIIAAGYDVIVPEWSLDAAPWDVPGTTGFPQHYMREQVYITQAQMFKSMGVTAVAYWDNFSTSTNGAIPGDVDFLYLQSIIKGGNP